MDVLLRMWFRNGCDVFNVYALVVSVMLLPTCSHIDDVTHDRMLFGWRENDNNMGTNFTVLVSALKHVKRPDLITLLH